MVFVQDEGSVFDAPVEVVWRFLNLTEEHTRAHRHRNVTRESLGEDRGRYSWEQEFEGSPTRFAMRWSAFAPLGIAYEVLAGPFTGSKFFLYYTPRGRQTGVSVVGEFTSGTIPHERLASSVVGFFSLEFDQDREAIHNLHLGNGA